MHIRARYVGGDVSSDGVTESGSTVRIELSTFVLGCNVDLGKVTETVGVGRLQSDLTDDLERIYSPHDLHVKRRLDKVNSAERPIGDHSGVVSRLCEIPISTATRFAPRSNRLTDTPSDLFAFSVSDDGVGVGRGEKAAASEQASASVPGIDEVAT